MIAKCVGKTGHDPSHWVGNAVRQSVYYFGLFQHVRAQMPSHLEHEAKHRTDIDALTKLQNAKDPAAIEISKEYVRICTAFYEQKALFRTNFMKGPLNMLSAASLQILSGLQEPNAARVLVNEELVQLQKWANMLVKLFPEEIKFAGIAAQVRNFQVSRVP